ncbi:MAG: hypothetical protein ABI691_03610 [Ginsengibacter sp.]
MKSFQIKDLTVILGSQTLDVNKQIFCHFGCSVQISVQCHLGCTLIGCTFLHTPICYQGCTNHFTPICPWACSHLGPSIPTPTFKDFTTPVVAELPNFKKSELQELRAGIAALQEKVDAQLSNTPEDLDLLEGKLKEALEDVYRQRQQNG